MLISDTAYRRDSAVLVQVLVTEAANVYYFNLELKKIFLALAFRDFVTCTDGI